MDIKKVIVESAKTVIVGKAAHMVVRKVLPKFVPGGVVGIIAVHLASKVLKSKKMKPK